MGFADMVARGCDDFLATAADAVHITARKVGELTVETSPIGKPETWRRGKAPADYKPGAFKSNWNLRVDAIDPSFDPNRTASFFVEGLDSIPERPFGHRLYFSNGAPYAWRIEVDQWSRQAPGGVVGPVALEFARINREAQAEAKAKSAGPRER